MADNEKLVFQIGFDLDSAVKDATSEWKRVQRELEAAINARPISISMDTRGLERFNTFVERTYASLEDLQDLFPEVFKETKDGEGITKRFQAMETSINAVSKEMRNLEKVWNNLSQAEKFDDDGNLTERAQELKRAYVELYQSQKTQGQTLQEITKEAINLANQEYEAQQRKKKQEEEFVRLLNLEETTLEKLQAKQGAWKQKLSQTEIGSSDWSNAIAEVQRLETKMKDLQKQIKGVATETKKTSKTEVDIDTSTFAGKLKDLENRWKALNAEQRKGAEGQALRVEWRELSEEADRYTSTLRSAVSAEDRLADAKKKTTKATHEQNSAYKTQGGYLQRLFQRMVAYASVAQAFSFIRNIRDVTAEFELQRVALGSIIGDLNEANAMFEQIKAAAVKSPFQIKELVTYTKQLAAYKIETDELFETTQKLADVSAGLGVGMERLVLAYGQIRATGYLRASEVRQLTEAGIPIVEELAKKMSDLRGETVSAAEVMQLISERAISFGMVKEVFDDMTSAGGMFYKMQEKQAETLAGQWSNLRDSISIMYEEIGNTEIVNNAMKGMIGLVKSLAENWRTIGIVVGGTLGSFLAMRGVSKMLPDISNYAIRSAKATRQYSQALSEMRIAIQNGNRALIGSARSNLRYAIMMRNAEKASSAFMRSLKRLWATLVANPWTAILTVLSALANVLYSAYENATRLDKELASIGSRGALEGDQQVRNFERLADVIKSSVNGSKQQTDAIKELKRSYGDFLPMQDEEIRKLLSAEGGYRAVSSAIREKIALQIQEQKINATTSAFGEDIGKMQDKIRKRLIDAGLSRDEISRFFAELENAIKDGVTDIQRELPKIFKKATNIDWATETIMARTGGSLFNPSYLGNLIDLLADYEEKIKDIESETHASLGPLDAYNQRYQELQETLKEATSDEEVGSYAWNEDIRAQHIMDYWLSIKDLIREAKDQGGLTQKDYEHLIGLENFDEVFKILEKKVPTMAGIVRKLRNEWAELMPTSMTQSINAQIISIAKTMGIPMDKVQSLLKQNSEDYATWAQRLKGIFDKSKDNVVAWRKTVNAALLVKPDALARAQGELEDAKDWEEFLKALNNAFQFSDGSRGGRQKNAWVSSMEERIKYMQDFQKGVENLAKTMPRDVAIIREQMIMLNRGVALGLDPKSLTGSANELIEFYRKAIEDVIAKIRNFKGFRGLTVEQILSTKTKNKTIQEYQALLQSLYNSMTDFETSQVARDMEDKLKQLSDDISRTKTAKEFFDRMLGMTGDKELSATLTLSVYGTSGDDLQKLMSQQILDAFKGVDISNAMLGGNKWDYNVLASLIGKLPKEQQKNAQSIVDNWRKANADIITDLYRTYEEFLSFEERKTKVVEKENAERMRILNSGLPMAEQEKLIGASQKRENKALADIAIEEFKASEDWAKSFEELEHLATPTIERLMGKLKEFIDMQKDLTPEQLRTLTNEYNKMYDELIARNPFKAMTDGIKDYVKATKDVKAAQERIEIAQAELRIATEHKATAEQNFKTSQDVASAGREYASAIREYNKATQNVAEADKNLGEALDAQKTALNKTIQGFNAASSAISNFGSIITDITEILGIAEDSEVGAFIKDLVKWLGVMAGVLSTVAAIIAVIDAELAPLLAVAAAVAALGAGISWVANINVRKAEKNIEALANRLDSLSYAYERLQKAQEKAFGSEYIQNYQRQLENLEAQQEAYLKQADLERSKGKKADKEKIKEYEEQARNTADAIKDMYGSLSEKFLGNDLASTARDFASAWIDAYKDFSNVTDAMRDKFQDMIQNMVMESLLAKVMEKALEPVFTMIDEMGDGDFYSTSFWQRVMSSMQTATENGVIGAQNVMSMLEQMGVNLRGLGGEMTGISRDIATASEESILGLAAGINTQNFYISQVPTKLDTIIGLLRGDGAMPRGSAITLQDVMIAQNQFLSHLPTIAQHTAETVAECKAIVAETRRTADALERVIKPDGTRTTYKMNVVTSYQG